MPETFTIIVRLPGRAGTVLVEAQPPRCWLREYAIYEYAGPAGSQPALGLSDDDNYAIWEILHHAEARLASDADEEAHNG